MNLHKRSLMAAAALLGMFVISADAGDVSLSGDTTLTSDLTITSDTVYDGGGYTVTRGTGTEYITVDGAKLTVRNVTFSGGTGKLFRVINGGSLTLGEGARVRDVVCGDKVGAPVVVWGGTFTMESGSEIANCTNPNERTPGGALFAGAVSVSSSSASDSVVHLNGGTIEACSCSNAGGIYIGVQSKVYISGDFTATGNTNLDGTKECNMLVQKESTLEVTGELTGGTIGYTAGLMASTQATGVFGTAYSGCTAEVAAKFKNDVTGATGLVDGTTLYWSEPPAPPQYENVSPTPIAFKSITKTDNGWTLVVTNVVEYCNYRLLYTDDLAVAFEPISDEWEEADHDGEWTVEVEGPGGARFWKAEGKDGIKPVGD